MTTVIMIYLVLLSVFSIVAGREINRLQGRVWVLERRLAEARASVSAGGDLDSPTLHTHSVHLDI